MSKFVENVSALIMRLCKAAASAGVSEVAEAAKGLTEAVDHVTSADKNRIEAKILRRELAEAERLLTLATMRDVEEYDPMVRRLRSAAKKGAAKKAAFKRTAVKKSAAKRYAVKKSAAKRYAVKKSAAAKRPAKRT